MWRTRPQALEEVVNARIETDWHPEADVRTNRSYDSVAPAANKHAADSAAPKAIDWYLYFSSREQADQAADTILHVLSGCVTLRSDGLRVLVRPGATGGWLALARSE